MTETAASDDESVERRNRKDRRIAIALYVMGMIVLFATLGGFLFDQYQRDMQAARERTAARADLVAEWVAGIFAVSDTGLSGVAELLGPSQRRRLFGEPPELELLEELLVRREESLELIGRVSIIDGQGRVVASSSSLHPPGFDVSGLPFFRLLQEQPTRMALVSPLQWSALERRHVVLLLHRLPDDTGLVMAQLDPAVFGQTLEGLSLTRGESIAIIDTEMQLVARRPGVGEAGAEEAAGEALGRRVVEPLTQAFMASGEVRTHLSTESPLDGSERLYTLRRVDDLPFVVVVGESRDLLLGDWIYRLWVRVVIGLVVMGLGWLLLRHYLNRLRLEEEVRRQARERELARREAHSREARLQALVSSIQDMIFVFDAEGRFTYVHAADPGELMADAASFLQRHYREVMPAAMTAQLDEAFEALRRGEGPVEYDYTLHIHGEPRQFHSVLSPLRELGEAREEGAGWCGT